MSNSARLQLGFSPLSKTIVLAKMRDLGDGTKRRVMKHIQPKTWQKLDSMGVKLEKITQLKQWHIGEYYGSPGRDVRLVKS